MFFYVVEFSVRQRDSKALNLILRSRPSTHWVGRGRGGVFGGGLSYEELLCQVESWSQEGWISSSSGIVERRGEMLAGRGEDEGGDGYLLEELRDLILSTQRIALSDKGAKR